MTYRSLQDIPMTKEIVLAEAERTLMDKIVQKRIRTCWQLRRTLAGMGALGQALKKTETYAIITILLTGSFIPKSWA